MLASAGRPLNQLPYATRLVVTLALLAISATVPGSVLAQEAFLDRNAPVKMDEAETDGVERLVDDRALLLDEFGRVPLLRITFAPGAELPSTFEIPEQDDPIPYFQEGLLILVEGSTFSVTTGGETVTVEEGQQIELAATTASPGLSVRNDGEAEGSLLVLRTVTEFEGRFPLNDYLLNQVAPKGIEFEQFFKRQDLVSRLLKVRLSLDRVTLSPGDELDSLDFGGTTGTLFVYLRMEAGAITGPEGTTEAEPLTPDSEVEFGLGVASESAVRAVGTEPAVFLVGRVAEAA